MATPWGMESGAGARLRSDDGLARRASKGDERAFAAIYRRYHQSLYRFCLSIVGNAEDAQDALQNTMVKALRALPGEERQIDLKPWLYRIAHNESVELLRKRRAAEPLDPEQATTGPGLAADVELRNRLRRLMADLGQLPERQRGALVMRELAGLEFAEIAAAFGTSPAVARQTLYEARLSLRQMDAGREMSCDAVTKALSDADGRVTRRRDIRAHLRGCADCRRFCDELDARRADLAALSPLPAAAAAGLLHGLLGGQAGSGSGLAAALGGGAAKSVATATAIKSAAAVAVVAVVGVGAAERGGLVDVGALGGSDAKQTRSEPPNAPVPPPAGPAAVLRSAAAGTGPAGVRPASALDVKTHRAAKPVEGVGAPADAVGEMPDVAGGTGGGVHPSGRGHEKRHPVAAAYGQQTAASHKAAGKGGGQGGGRSTQGHPAKSPKQPKTTHPTHPPKPSKPAQAAQPAAGSAGKGAGPKPAQAGGDPATAAPQQDATEPSEAAPGPEAGQ